MAGSVSWWAAITLRSTPTSTSRSEISAAQSGRMFSTALDNGQRSPRRLLRAVVDRLLGRKP